MAYFPFEEGKDGALAEGEGFVPAINGAIVYLRVDEIDGVLARLRTH